jgi:CRISPR/Cas system endoribonuclease Cas6 (RAMP superfamily)
MRDILRFFLTKKVAPILTKSCTYWHLVTKIKRIKRGKNREKQNKIYIYLSTCVSKVLEGLYSRVILAFLGLIPQENKCER